MSSSQSPQLPAIFLTHSGANKEFVLLLNSELQNANYNPFFDRNSSVDVLPKGIPFASRILEACRACKLGVVVLSHNYIESLWPMLELQQIFFHNPHKPYIFPLFYKLRPSDLSKKEHLTQWHEVWKAKEAHWKGKVQQMQEEMSLSDVTLDFDLWDKALELLRGQSGQTLPDNKDEHAYIQAIVSNIRKILPPPLASNSSMGPEYKGAEHIQETIHELFERHRNYDDFSSSILGLYGMGGTGKTTACHFMLSFYDKDYPGNCYLLQFPSNRNSEGQLFLQSIKKILSQHGNMDEQMLNKVNGIEQAMCHLQILLRRYKVFLAIDNIWDCAFQDAKQILEMQYVPGSKLLVTARSKGLLQRLMSADHKATQVRKQRLLSIYHVPSMSEAEAIEALKAYSFSSLGDLANAEDIFCSLAKSCFFGRQCHPLLLKAVGGRLHLPMGLGTTRRRRALESISERLHECNILGDGEIKEEIVSVLRKSFDAMSSPLRTILLMLGACVPKEYLGNDEGLPKAVEWLSLICGDGSQSIEVMRAQIYDLEYHGLIHVFEDILTILPLHMMMIKKIVEEEDGAPRGVFFEGDVTTLSERDFGSLKYIYGYGEGERALDVFGYSWYLRKVLARKLHAPEILSAEVLRLSNASLRISRNVFRLGNALRLRHLELNMVSGVEAVKHWEEAPNLVSVVISCCKDVVLIASMEALSRLRELVLERLGKWRNTDILSISKVAHCTALERCILHSNPRITSFPSLALGQLRKLDLSNCEGLKSMEGSMCNLTALEELSLAGCVSLKSVPDLKRLAELRSLKLEGCIALEEVKVGEATLTRLQYLSLQYRRTRLCIGMSSAALCISAFTNLRALYVQGDLRLSASAAGREQTCTEVRSLRLPAKLEELSLSGFTSAQEMPDLSALAKTLTRLELNGCPDPPGMDTLRKLEQW